MTHSAQPELEWNGNYPVNHSNLCLRNHDAQLCISSTFKNCSGERCETHDGEKISTYFPK